MRPITFTTNFGLQGLIDPKEIIAFYSKLKIAYGKFVGTSSLIGLFVDEQGDGLFTAAGARAGKALFLNVIDGKKSVPGTNWPILSPEQSYQHKKQSGYGRHWKFKGHIYRNIIARKVGKGWEIGLRKNKTVFATRWAGKTGDKIPIGTYAAWVEYGTKKMDPRPLFSPISIYYNKTLGKQLAHVADLSIKEFIKEYSVSKDIGKYVTRTDGGGMSQASMNAANPNGDFDSVIMNHNLRSAEFSANGINMTKYVGRAGLSHINKVKKKTYAEISKSMKKVAGNHELVDNAENWLKNNADLLKEFDD